MSYAGSMNSQTAALAFGPLLDPDLEHPQNMGIPEWLAKWWRGGDTGTSSRTIAAVLSGNLARIQTTDFGIPADTSDVGRCVRLLDLAKENGQDWRARMPYLASVISKWEPLTPRWAEVEEAFHADVIAQKAWDKACLVSDKGRKLHVKRKDIPMPPSRCWYLVSTLTGYGDPYRGREVPWSR
jgi:hypothetical protein